MVISADHNPLGFFDFAEAIGMSPSST